MDKISVSARSRNMSKIRSKNTKPEILLRKALFAKGLRYRIHYNLPGKPDIVFPSKKIAIFVHGCFWHGHGCKIDHSPRSNKTFWKEKIKMNRIRDKRNETLLKANNWETLTYWECEINNIIEFDKAITEWVANKWLKYN